MGVDFASLMQGTSNVAPMLIAYLIGAGLLIANRRLAPRPCIVAACVCLGMFVQYFAMKAALLWLHAHQDNGGTLVSPMNCMRLDYALYLYSYFDKVPGIVMLTWCVLMGRKPVPAVDE